MFAIRAAKHWTVGVAGRFRAACSGSPAGRFLGSGTLGRVPVACPCCVPAFRVRAVAVRTLFDFLWFLARRESIGQPVQQVPLQVAIPQPAHHATPAQSVATIQQLSFDLLHRIRVRLAIFSQFPGWATSDEIDYALEILRWLHPTTSFCGPASWNHHTRELRFLNNRTTDHTDISAGSLRCTTTGSMLSCHSTIKALLCMLPPLRRGDI